MDIIDIALAKNFAKKMAAGFTNVEVDGMTINFTLIDGQTVSLTVPTPADGVSVTDLEIDENGDLICTMSDGTEINAGKALPQKGIDYFTEEDINSIKENVEEDLNAKIQELENINQKMISNYDTATTESNSNIHIIDALNGPNQGIIVGGQVTQDTNERIYICIGTESGDYYFTYNNVNYQFTMPAISANDILIFNTITLKLYLNDTEITTTTDNTGILITLSTTPNPNYAVDIVDVTGIQQIICNNKNLSWTGWAEDFVKRVNNTSLAKISMFEERKCLIFEKRAGYNKYDSQYVFKPIMGFKENTQYTFSFQAYTTNGTTSNFLNLAIEYTDGSTSEFTLPASGKWYPIQKTSSENKTIKYVRPHWRNGFGYIDLDTFQVEEGTQATKRVAPQDLNVTLHLGDIHLGKIKTANNYLYKNVNRWYWHKEWDIAIMDGSETWTERVNSSKLKQFIGTQTRATTVLSENQKCNYGQYAYGTFNTGFIGNFCMDANTKNIRINVPDDLTLENWKTRLQNKNLISYYPLAASIEIEIRDDDGTLKSELEQLEKMQTTKEGTNILVTTNEKNPAELEITYLTI